MDKYSFFKSAITLLLYFYQQYNSILSDMNHLQTINSLWLSVSELFESNFIMVNFNLLLIAVIFHMLYSTYNLKSWVHLQFNIRIITSDNQ